MTTALAGLAAWGLLTLLERRSAHATTAWTAIAAVVLAVSLTGPLGNGVDTASKLVLACLHLGAAIPVITLMRRSIRLHGYYGLRFACGGMTRIPYPRASEKRVLVGADPVSVVHCRMRITGRHEVGPYKRTGPPAFQTRSNALPLCRHISSPPRESRRAWC
jgi:hypothetical protein